MLVSKTAKVLSQHNYQAGLTIYNKKKERKKEKDIKRKEDGKKKDRKKDRKKEKKISKDEI